MKGMHDMRHKFNYARHFIGIAFVVSITGIVLLFLISGCGNSSGNPSANSKTPVAKDPKAHLYSRIDYPLEIQANKTDTVTLTLSVYRNYLYVTPSSGQGVTTGDPIPLPTDLTQYRAIDVTADVDAASSGPIIWQLVSSPRQPLLTESEPHSYVQEQIFSWRITATGGGKNTARIIVGLYFVYLDGTEKKGTIELTANPVPILASTVAASASNDNTDVIRIPLIGVTGTFGIIAILWNVIQWLTSAYDTFKMAHDLRKKWQTRDRPPVKTA
jgi:hypothetical protein